MNKPLVILASLALSGAPGCNIVGPAVVLLHGPEQTAAAYTLDPARPTVFFVDDRSNRLTRRSLRLTIATTAQDILLKEGALKNVIDAKAPLTRVSGESPDEPTDIASLGKTVGAEVVVYITVDGFALSPDGAAFQPIADLRIKVIDCVKTPARLWPEEPAGKELRVSMTERQDGIPKTSAAATKAMERLAEECGRSVAELFYKHNTKRRVSETNN